MNESPSATTGRRALRRAIAAFVAFAMLATGCGSGADESGSNSAGTPGETAAAAPASTSDDTTDAGAGESADAVSVASPAEDASDTTPVASGDVTINGVADFESQSGTFAVAVGGDVLGCERGSFEEQFLAAVVERVFTCESGQKSGTFTVHFLPEMVGPGRFTSEWTVEGSTGDFAGLEGKGDFLGEMYEDETGADGTWTGEVAFGAPADAAGPAADATDGADGDIETFLAERVDRLRVPDGAGVVMAAIIDGDGNAVSAVGGTNPDGSVPSTADPIRVGSITKVITSLTTLSLVDDGLLGLDDRATEHLTRVAVPDGVTVRDLLQHTSGIPSYTDVEAFFGAVLDDPTRRWVPEEMIEFVADQEPMFAPGERFEYSNTNYALLGILIEELTGRPLHEVVRERVLDPAGMSTTYLAGAEDGPAPTDAYTEFGDRPLSPIDFDYTAIATSAWSGGALVSSAEDLHRMFTVLFDGDIITDEMRREMTANEEYGLGIDPWDAADTLVGHGGDIPGYHTLVFHAPESGQTAFWVSTSDGLFFHPLVEDTVQAMIPELAG